MPSKPGSHTAGRLCLDFDGRTVVIESTDESFTLSAYAPDEGDRGPKGRLAEANARRLVAVWNAARGLTTESLEIVASFESDEARLSWLSWHSGRMSRELAEVSHAAD